MTSSLTKFRSTLDGLAKNLFAPGHFYAPFSILFLLALYLFGVFLWCTFFNWHHSSISYFDWATINLPRYEVIRDALRYGQFPLHLADPSSLHNLTDRFWGLPDVITTPQMLAMLFVDADTFAILDVLFFYTLATAGLIYFKKKFNLSLIAYSILFFLFNFNGYIQAHYSAGHASWGGYFLFPWVFILIFNFVEAPQGWRWVTAMAFLFFYMLLAGSEHHFLWLCIFLLGLGLTNLPKLKWILAAIISSGLLGAVRLLPPLLEVSRFTSDPGLKFFSGYQSTGDVLTSLIFLSKPINDLVDTGKDLVLTPLFPWETDIFIGLVGGCFLLYFGVFKWAQDQNVNKRFATLILPALIVFLLAQGDVYGATLFHIPFFASERVSARMIAVPLVLLMFTAALYFQDWLNQTKHPLAKLGTLIGLPILVSDLWSHLSIWRVDVMIRFFHPYAFHAEGNSIANHADPPYIAALLIGLAITVFSGIFLLFQSWRERKRKTDQVIAP